jgi:putative addiction module component (TIGR02574 family)
MNERVQRLTDEATRLPPDERAELVEGILQSLDPTDPNLDELWAAEVQDRIAAYRRGEMGTADFDSALATLRLRRERS